MRGWSAETWAALAGVLALALSIFNFSEVRYRRWRNGRRASLEVRFEEFRDHTIKDTFGRASGSTNRSYRFVLKNHGPARATDVNLEMDHDIWKSWLPDGVLPIPLLHPGQEFPLPVGPGFMAHEVPTVVFLEWKDVAGSHRVKTWTAPFRVQ